LHCQGFVPVHDRGRVLADAAVVIAQLAGEEFLVGLGRQRNDPAGQLLAPVPGLCSTTACGLARRFTEQQWRAVEARGAAITAGMLAGCRRRGRRR
jgi:hypothetical protein